MAHITDRGWSHSPWQASSITTCPLCVIFNGNGYSHHFDSKWHDPSHFPQSVRGAMGYAFCVYLMLLPLAPHHYNQPPSVRPWWDSLSVWWYTSRVGLCVPSLGSIFTPLVHTWTLFCLFSSSSLISPCLCHFFWKIIKTNIKITHLFENAQKSLI